jgi:hypothetical protein
MSLFSKTVQVKSVMLALGNFFQTRFGIKGKKIQVPSAGLVVSFVICVAISFLFLFTAQRYNLLSETSLVLLAQLVLVSYSVLLAFGMLGWISLALFYALMGGPFSCALMYLTLDQSQPFFPSALMPAIASSGTAAYSVLAFINAATHSDAKDMSSFSRARRNLQQSAPAVVVLVGIAATRLIYGVQAADTFTIALILSIATSALLSLCILMRLVWRSKVHSPSK